MTDIEAIRRVLVDYCFATDSGDTETWARTMSEEIVWEGGAFGRFEGREGARAYHQAAGEHTLNFRHVMSNHRIDVTGDTAIAQCYVQVFDQSGPAPVTMFSGFYDDDLAREGGRWVIRTRRLVSDPRAVRVLAQEPVAA